MSEQIQVQAGWWRQRCGDVVRVWPNDDDDAEYPWASESCSYTHEGSMLDHLYEAEDLVEFLGVDDPTRRPDQEQRRELVRRFAVALLTRHGDSLAPDDAWDLAMRMADAEPQGG